jgi:cytochrome c oxidase subunit 4
VTNHVIRPKTYLSIFGILIGLTIVTIGIDLLVRAGQISLGDFQTVVALSIATVKASLVILFFMHLWYSTRLTWVVALSSLLWLGILVAYTVTDYWTRGSLGVPGH